ncbi:hypothetical protein Y032_0187g1108 [Ancylostoma ceylanicum]|uniref:Uncharacterized protein n=1 Tax=Ancylostoma ceylanicum TaxID=53326 RepID=A0A016SR13_9BILA|nr:hypothetical protein Y032_0187g1108 [Ancylostoma ceylanicum]
MDRIICAYLKTTTVFLVVPTGKKAAFAGACWVNSGRRFTVSPGKVITPAQSANRRYSLTRRNAFCSLEANEARLKERDDDVKSEGSCERTHLKHHLTLHGIADYHTLVKSYMRQAKKYLHYMQFGHAKPERRPMYMYDLSQDEVDCVLF